MSTAVWGHCSLSVCDGTRVSVLSPCCPSPRDASKKRPLGRGVPLLEVTALGPGLCFPGLRKLRTWPGQLLDKQLLAGRAWAASSLGILLGVHTRPHREPVPVAALPHFATCSKRATAPGSERDDGGGGCSAGNQKRPRCDVMGAAV